MARWTKRAAIARASDNALLQAAMRVEPRLIPVIEEATRQRKTRGYNRIRKYVELRNRAMRFVGWLAEGEALQASKYYDVVIAAIDDLLPFDNVDWDLYPEERPLSERGKLTPQLRWLTLERDNFTCRACGRSRLHEDDIKLQVDHIIPISKGGKTELRNLQTLCQDCNLGKGARIVEQMKSRD